MSENFQVRKVAVLGAGVMGAQIAAHLVNASVETLLFELPAKEGDPNANVIKAIDGLGRLDPSPIAAPVRLTFIRPANYEQHIELLRDCDLVIEAIAERIDWKSGLYRKVAQFFQMLPVVGGFDECGLVRRGERRGIELFQVLDGLAHVRVRITLLRGQLEQQRLDIGIDQMRGDLRAHHPCPQHRNFSDMQ